MSHDTWKARLHTKMDALAQWHQKIAFFHIIGPLPMTRLFVLLAIAASLFAALANYQIRANQYERWVDNKDVTFLDGTPLFSTTDASFFVGLAQQYRLTGDKRDHSAKRLYPANKNNYVNSEPKTSVRDFPLLSIIIATLSSDSTSKSLLLTAHALIPVFAFLTALGVVFAFGAAGYWLEGSVAAIGGGLAPTFLMRSSVGRIDTDILNLGFFYTLLGLCILAARAKSWQSSLAWVTTAAIVMNLFLWWYNKAFMGWAFAACIMWLSVLSSRSLKRPLLLTFVFVVISGLAFKNLGIAVDSGYLQDKITSGILIYPNTFETITELRVASFYKILVEISGSAQIGVVGLIGLALFVFRHPVLAITYSPALALGFANFLVGNRTIFYLAPMIWFGVAFISIMLVKLIWSYFSKHRNGIFRLELLSSSTAAVLLMMFIWNSKPIQNYTPTPSFPKNIMSAFASLNGKLPEGSVIATWWDYGYASMLFNGYNTLHDGGLQTTPVTHYFARALLSETQSESNAILHLLAGGGLDVIGKNSQSHQTLENLIASNTVRSEKPIFLVLTSQMASWMGSISNLGMWDTKTGQPIDAPNNPYGSTLFYSNLNCGSSDTPYIFICNNLKFNLRDGSINGSPAIKLYTEAANGVMQTEIPFNENGLQNLHFSEENGNRNRVMLMHMRLAQSTFHNLFHLARVNNEKFQLVYDDYPHVRIFLVK